MEFPLSKNDHKIIEKASRSALEANIFDLVSRRVFIWQTFFESLDGFETTSNGGKITAYNVTVSAAASTGTVTVPVGSIIISITPSGNQDQFIDNVAISGSTLTVTLAANATADNTFVLRVLNGGVEVKQNEIEITTDGDDNDVREVTKLATIQGITSFFDRSRMRTAFNLSNVTNVTAYITVGDVQAGSEGYGFKIVNNSLKGVTHDGTSENTEDLKTINTDTFNLQAEHDPRSGAVTFIVDDVEEGRSVANLPSGVSSGAAVVFTTLMNLHLKATATEIKLLQTSFFQYSQFRRQRK